jgi:hypothetical protein
MSQETKDIVELATEVLSGDRTTWVKLSSNVLYRRLELLLLKEILLELRKLNQHRPSAV